MIRYLSIILISLFCLSATSQDYISEPDDIIGFWMTEKDSKIEIYKQDGIYYGRTVEVDPKRYGKPDTLHDQKNPDASLRDRPIIGLVFMTGFLWDEKEKEWNDGKVYDPESGNTYSGFMRMESHDSLYLRGFIGIAIIGRTTYWTRVDDPKKLW